MVGACSTTLISYLLFLFLPCHANAAAPLAGGAGYAYYLDAFDGSTVSLLWENSPADALTCESYNQYERVIMCIFLITDGDTAIDSEN
jgi:hypothetical protein